MSCHDLTMVLLHTRWGQWGKVSHEIALSWYMTMWDMKIWRWLFVPYVPKCLFSQDPYWRLKNHLQLLYRDLWSSYSQFKTIYNVLFPKLTHWGRNKTFCRWHICAYSWALSDDIVSAMAIQITGVSMVCSAVCSGADQRKHQSSASLAFVRWI